ncbi:MAG: 4-alpha-glucanotransferase, partial [Clostridia bacterium]|nr:4-alpha-glucanotransferase [Clostridia bacterium]
ILRWNRPPASLPLLWAVNLEGINYQVRQFNLPAGLPPGYHRFVLELSGHCHEAVIIAAPGRSYSLAANENSKLWGCFLPLYALHSRQSWGAGDFGDLGVLLDWLHGLGGKLVGTLPLLAAFLDEPFAPSPYEPVSRLFWNEFYLDVSQVEELQISPQARELINSPSLQQEIAALRSAPLVDYRRGMALKRKVLEQCAAAFFAAAGKRQAALQQWLTANPAARNYAQFRATTEQQCCTWPYWPERMREGNLRQGDYSPEVVRYHLYVQWLVQQQLQKISARARQKGQRLYLDYPLGVHCCGYDVWWERRTFVLTASGGSPPDAFFTGGQDWGIAPMHPQRLREQGYRYFIASIQNHLRYAGALRLDHIMGLHHLYWIPRGLKASEGVYVRYHAEELYAILCLESWRHQALLVGEDLGTVPAYIRKVMARHRIKRMYVLPYEYSGQPRQALRPIEAETLVCLNTHDMPPFAASWRQKSKLEKAVLALFLYRQGQLRTATTEVKEVTRACLKYLAASPANILLVNLEDLWQEMEPQNVPGTSAEARPNWRRKARYALEEFSTQSELLQTLQELNRLRNNN